MGCLKIAIADDNENMLRALGQVINGESDMNLVGTATNGKDTYDIIKSKEPDVVLLDIIMPNGDGLAVMQKVQQDKEIKKRNGIYHNKCSWKRKCYGRCFQYGSGILLYETIQQ